MPRCDLRVRFPACARFVYKGKTRMHAKQATLMYCACILTACVAKSSMILLKKHRDHLTRSATDLLWVKALVLLFLKYTFVFVCG